MDNLEYHPHKPFIPTNAKKLIIGNFPIGRFSNIERFHEQKVDDLNFYYGGTSNKLWKILSIVFNEELTNVIKIKIFLKLHQFAVADIIYSCRRIGGSGLDTALYDKTYNTQLISIIQKQQFEEFYFTSKHVYSEFRKHIGQFPEIKHTILISPSPTAIRGLIKNKEYLGLLKEDPKLKIEEFRLMKYKQAFGR